MRVLFLLGVLFVSVNATQTIDDANLDRHAHRVLRKFMEHREGIETDINSLGVANIPECYTRCFQAYADSLTFSRDMEFLTTAAACVSVYALAMWQFYFEPKIPLLGSIATPIAGGMTGFLAKQAMDKVKYGKVGLVVMCAAALAISRFEEERKWHFLAIVFPFTGNLLNTLGKMFFPKTAPPPMDLRDYFKKVPQKDRFEFCRFLSILAVRKNWLLDRPDSEAAPYLHKLEHPNFVQATTAPQTGSTQLQGAPSTEPVPLRAAPSAEPTPSRRDIDVLSRQSTHPSELGVA